EFKIFNRWGQLVYDNSVLGEGAWDGKYKDVEQPMDGYIYLLQYYFFLNIFTITFSLQRRYYSNNPLLKRKS
ncbi:MAG: gliding motility-associated C-terminal domain-containing protein, partial [Flavobacteriaceae bacterium]|nr:gliding motility-associated C-terminal domain-containing protein [Flavobacteriaceae bacterium]